MYYGPIQAAPPVQARKIGGTKTHERPEKGTGARAGFTLPELLVAIAIFISVMGGVALLFVNSIRTIRQGFQTQEVFEQARGALNIIERDLKRAFTSRDHGDYYSFYGTPIGFTFVGLVSQREGNPTDNVSRVTYVIHHDNTGRGILNTIDDDDVYTYSLLRYVEPNIEDLDKFPIDWYNGNLALSYTENGGTVGELLDSVLLDDAFLNCRDPNDPNNCTGNVLASLTPRGLEILNAKKREIWIRMLSGGDYEVPDAWYNDTSDPNLAQFQATVWGPSGFPGPPDDFIVSENILYGYTPPFIDPAEPATTLLQYFASAAQLGASGPGQIISLSGNITGWPANGYCTIWKTRLNLDQTRGRDGSLEIVAYQVSTAAPDTLIIPEEGRGLFGTAMPTDITNQVLMAVYVDAYPASFFTYTEFQDTDGFIQPQHRRFWNDLRNISRENPRDGIDNDNDGYIDEIDDVGSPFAPRIPAQVGSSFTLFFESPYAGAPDFTRAFDQEIDIPTGYRRFPAE